VGGRLQAWLAGRVDDWRLAGAHWQHDVLANQPRPLPVNICPLHFCFAPHLADCCLVLADMNVYDIRKQCEGPLCYREFEASCGPLLVLGVRAATLLHHLRCDQPVVALPQDKGVQRSVFADVNLKLG
jgi:hypothetical protein